MPYGRTSRISRSLDESELMVDEKISNHIASAMPADVYAGVPISMGYEWMKEDLALRSAKADQLAQEQRLAYAASERKALADQVDRQNRDDDETVAALREMSDMVQSGKALSAADARAQFFSKNPEAVMNKRLMEASSAFGASEFDREEFLREKTRKETAGLEVELKKKNTEGLLKAARENPDMFDRVIKLRMETEALQAENGLADEEYAKKYRKDTEELITHKRAAELAKLQRESPMTNGTVINWEDVDAQVQVQGSLDRAGLDAVNDIPGMMKKWGGSPLVTGMLSDANWLTGKSVTPEERKQLSEDLNNPEGGAMVRKIAGRWAYEKRNEIAVNEAQKLAREEQAKSMGNAQKMMSGFTKAVNEATTVDAVKAAAAAQVAALANFPGFSDLAQNFDTALKNEVWQSEIKAYKEANSDEEPDEETKTGMYQRAAGKVFGRAVAGLNASPAQQALARRDQLRREGKSDDEIRAILDAEFNQ